LTGRVLLEAAVSDWAAALTLTYDDKKLYSPDQAKFLHHDDLRQAIRKARYHSRCRYVAAGEYGKRSTKRAHWHLLLLGVGLPPKLPEPYKNGETWRFWPYGFTYYEPVASEKAIRYITKYLVKERSEIAKNKQDPTERHRLPWVGYSKQPILGAHYIRMMAERQADMRVFPRTFNYRPPGGHPSKWRYTLQGKAQMEYFTRLFEIWPEGEDAPKTEWMENAYNRFKKWRQAKWWQEYCKQAYSSQAGHAVLFEMDKSMSNQWPRKELTKSERLWQDFQQTPEYWEGREWQGGQGEEKQLVFRRRGLPGARASLKEKRRITDPLPVIKK
jgi:hypothetical protein